MKQLYELCKETIGRIFGIAKENHSFWYTQIYGKAQMEMKANLTYMCMNLKKLAKIKQSWKYWKISLPLLWNISKIL